jgi:hypothetical protein
MENKYLETGKHFVISKIYYRTLENTTYKIIDCSSVSGLSNMVCNIEYIYIR